MPLAPKKALTPGEGDKSSESNAVKRFNLIRVIAEGVSGICNGRSAGEAWRGMAPAGQTVTPAGQATPVPPWPQ